MHQGRDGREVGKGLEYEFPPGFLRIRPVHCPTIFTPLGRWSKSVASIKNLGSSLRYADDTTLNGRKRRTKEPLDGTERGEWKKLASNSTFRKLRSWHVVPSFHSK